MDTTVFSTFAQFGLAGVILAVLVWQLRAHADERAQLRREHQEQISRIVAVVDANTRAINDFRAFIAGFKETVRHCEKHTKR